MNEKKPISPKLWGKDHKSTLVFIETICVDQGGVPGAEKMRTWSGRPLRGKVRGFPSEGGGRDYPTRLADGTEVSEHDDWDCVDDMVAAGLVIWGGTGTHPVFELTDLGWVIVSMMRRCLATTHLAGKRSLKDFNVADAIKRSLDARVAA